MIQAYSLGPEKELRFTRSTTKGLIERRGHRVRNDAFPYSRCDEAKFGIIAIQVLEFEDGFMARDVMTVLRQNPHLTNVGIHHVLAFEEQWSHHINEQAAICGLRSTFEATVSETMWGPERTCRVLAYLSGVKDGHRSAELCFDTDPFPKGSLVLLAKRKH